MHLTSVAFLWRPSNHLFWKHLLLPLAPPSWEECPQWFFLFRHERSMMADKGAWHCMPYRSSGSVDTAGGLWCEQSIHVRAAWCVCACPCTCVRSVCGCVCVCVHVCVCACVCVYMVAVVGGWQIFVKCCSVKAPATACSWCLFVILIYHYNAKL